MLTLTRSLICASTSIRFVRVIILTTLFVGTGTFIIWDHSEVERDFTELKDLLKRTRSEAFYKNQTLEVQFSGKTGQVIDRKTNTVISRVEIPSLDEVNYDTTLGNDTIVFDANGTSAYNKRVHGGDLRLRSWFGFRKNIAVNCTGLVTEDVYPGE